MKEKIIRVVLLCQYWNDEAARMVGGGKQIIELSPWIQETINLFKNKNDIELYVVAPNYGTNKNCVFYKNNIHYHYYKYSLNYLPKILTFLFNLFSKKKKGNGLFMKLNVLTFHFYPKLKINQTVNKINPDLIHLYGSENLVYSVGALSLLNKYPMVLTIQGYAYLQNIPTSFVGKIEHSRRISIEAKINNNIKWCANLEKSEYFNPFDHGQIFFPYYPITKIPNVSADKVKKEYDIVFYARLIPEKGIEDLIEAIGLLNQKNIRLKVLIIGESLDHYLSSLKILAKQRKITDLLTFVGFVPKNEDVYTMASTAKMLVLPTHNDGFNNTIREAMYMKLPVIANEVGIIPVANKHQECITLAKLGDIEDLAKKIELVLNDSARTERLLENAFNEMINHYNPNRVYDMGIDIYRKIIADTIKNSGL